MAYNDTPLVHEQKRDSGNKIQENFSILRPYLEYDHAPINAGVGDRVHKRITLEDKATPPPSVAGEFTLFSQKSVNSGKSELFFKNDAVATVFEMTSSGFGWSRLSSGLLIKYGIGTAYGGYHEYKYPVSAGTEIPVFRHVYTAQLSLASFDTSTIIGDVDRAVRLIDFTQIDRLIVFAGYRYTFAPPIGATDVKFHYFVIGD